MTPKPLPPLADSLQNLSRGYDALAESVRKENFATHEHYRGFAIALRESAQRSAPYDAELARLRAENLELRRVGAVLYECALRKEPRDMEAAIEACLAWERLQEAAP